MAIPAKFRQQLPDGDVFITTLPEGCLIVYPKSEWDSLINENLGRLDPLSREDRKMKRDLIKEAGRFPLDKQGRINLTADHIKSAGIKKGVVFVGALNSFEVWGKEEWEKAEASPGDMES